ncbi:hypothetical protein DSO57_1019765 [Entomophthora muscae]|uniref:Uncharacterized protein n=1 Tax=Entomophthora muscae TaxID=34485 RepID=A0ACC2TEP3_9FUNG|nr:hypothetical protein DSO57_1019765 [Entomophthora muscae]
MPHLQKDHVRHTNENVSLANNPEITGATSGKELKKPSVECGPPEDDKSCGLKGKLEFSHSDSTNERHSGQDATNDFCRVLRRSTDTQQEILTLGLDSY